MRGRLTGPCFCPTQRDQIYRLITTSTGGRVTTSESEEASWLVDRLVGGSDRRQRTLRSSQPNQEFCGGRQSTGLQAEKTTYIDV